MSARAHHMETLAFRAALKAFSDTLDRELGGVDREAFDELRDSRHRHVSILCVGKGATPIALFAELTFSDDPSAIEAAMDHTRKGASS